MAALENRAGRGQPKGQRAKRRREAKFVVRSWRPFGAFEDMNQEPVTRLVDTKGAAELVPLSASTFHKLRVYGGGPKFIKIGHRIFDETTALQEWAARHRHASTSEYISAERRKARTAKRAKV
jgi:hypothetical protein